MAKKNKPKSNGHAAPSAKVDDSGDLRDVEALVKKWKAGDMVGAEGLMDLGRDASFLVLALGEKAKDEELLAFGKKLVAVPPRVPTNLHALREASVEKLIKANLDAPAIESIVDLEIGTATAFFDPRRVAADLARYGRPRREAKRLEAGDLAWFGIPAAAGKLDVLTSALPEGAPAVRLRLQVDSGLVFLGPPEASDGARLGTVKLDPFHTGLDDLAAKGRFARLKPGTYALHAYLAGSHHVRVHLVPDPDKKAPLDLVEATVRGLEPPGTLAR
jgi:hypothetical protein